MTKYVKNAQRALIVQLKVSLLLLQSVILDIIARKEVSISMEVL
jgi:hypothetical protein